MQTKLSRVHVIGILLAIMLMTTGIGSADPINKVYGIDFSPYMDGQNPEYGSTVTSTQVQERMQIIAPYTIWIRSYGTENGLEYVASTAHNMGLKTTIGAWLSADSAANERQINELINEMKAGHVDLAIVGSETLFRNDLSEEQLINYIKRVKEAAPGINVTTADTYSEILSHPNVIKECDLIMYNVYPYWEGIGIENAITVLDGRHKNIVNIAGDKAVIISETGWPSGGNTIGSAIPSPENSARYFNEFVSWARKNNIQYFYFEAFDETWKVNNEGPQGAHWGIWDKDGNMKAGMETVFLITEGIGATDSIGDSVGVYNSEGTWALWNTTTNSADIVGFGWEDTEPIVGDWNGDGITEVGIYNTPGNNFLIQTTSGFELIGLGWPGVYPVAGDWNGDGADEVGVYNNEGTWALWNLDTNSAYIMGFGWADTEPIVGDWDADGITEVGIYNIAGNNFLIKNDSGFDVIGLGWPGVTPVVGDWNGDGADDVGVYNNEGTWALWNTTTNSADIVGFGWEGTEPIVGDWDGDGITEVGIYNRDGHNYLIKKSLGFHTIGLGWPGVIPVVGFWSADLGPSSPTINKPPVLSVIGSKTVDEGRLLSFTISATDPNGDKVTYSATGLPTGASLDANTGKFTWTPASGTAGTYTVTFIATANGQTDSETITVTVLYTPQNKEPSIKIASLAPYGTSGSASGFVEGVDTSAYKVAVYIYVSGWWNKPYWASPLTTINSDGKWTCDIDTGGNDEYATKVAAFVVPKTYEPPELHGGNLPSELFKAAIVYEIIDR